MEKNNNITKEETKNNKKYLKTFYMQEIIKSNFFLVIAIVSIFFLLVCFNNLLASYTSKLNSFLFNIPGFANILIFIICFILSAISIGFSIFQIIKFSRKNFISAWYYSLLNFYIFVIIFEILIVSFRLFL